jgi:hypothetical protein
MISAFLISGVVTLWTRTACLPQTACALPTALDAPTYFQFNIDANTSKPGTYPSKEVSLRIKEYDVHIELFTVVKENQKPYYITQTYLSHQGNLITQCSQYSDTISFFPVGSCSGLYKGKQIGVSFLKPVVSDR